jgi:tetratricopeptide (TPR) repeat protein
MPDISQIVPLAAILGVTTDCLLGVGGDEKADREQLYRDAERIRKGIEKIYRRCDNAYYECYQLYREHIKKYPLDFETKFLCADSLTRCIYYDSQPAEEKAKLYEEAVGLLKSVIDYDRDTTRQIDARQTLIILYLYRNDFANAEETARSLPQKGNIRTSMEIEIYSKRNEHQKCLELADRACNEAAHHYLWALAVRAKRISLLGNERKSDAIAAWRELADAAKWNYKKLQDIKINTKWLYSALNHLSNNFIALAEPDRAFDVIEELTDRLIQDYHTCKNRGDTDAALEIKRNFSFYLHSCCNLCDSNEANRITDGQRFRACEQRLESLA